MQDVTPMIHVPDVRATAGWYTSIGFRLVRYNEDHGVLDWALLAFGTSEVMLSLGGKPSREPRREVDLYVRVADLDGTYKRLKSGVEVVEEPHDTFYGMREFVVRDLNGFWITFGRPSSG